MTEEIKKLIELQINARMIENRSNYALFNEGMRKGSEIAKEIILSKWQEAERWRKVEEELPENNENLIIKKESKLTTQPVLIKTVGGGLFVDYRVKTVHENLDGWVEFWNWTRFNNNQVTEWKPIS